MNQMAQDGGRKTIVQYGVNHTEDDINDSLPDSVLASEDDEGESDEMDFNEKLK